MTSEFKYDVAIIGGCGHVGLPLGLVLADKGLKVVGIDINHESINKVKNKIMPFHEAGSQEILEKVIDKFFFITNDDTEVSKSEHIIITIETPVDKDFSVDLSKIELALTSLMPYFRQNQVIIFRSTLAPRTTDYVKNFLETKTTFKIGKTLYLATVPERIVQNNAVIELTTLPNIIGTYDDISYEKASKLFKILNPEIIRTTPLEAELSKLFTNSYRYATFALANEYFIIAETLGANMFNIVKAMNHKYPRCGLPYPGFAKGPCLGKDSWLLLNAMPHFNVSTTMISSAYRINDGLPMFLLHKIKESVDLNEKKVAVLGLTFKKDTDDTRDSLCLKLVSLLKNEFVNYTTHDPYVDNKDIRGVLKDADVVILAMNHSYYEKLDFKNLVKPDALIVDKWNMLKRDKFIFRGYDLR